MTFLNQRTEVDRVFDSYLNAVDRLICIDCSQKNGKLTYFKAIEVKGHAHVAKPCGHVLWRDFGHHRVDKFGQEITRPIKKG
jgi:hypothetical protein